MNTDPGRIRKPMASSSAPFTGRLPPLFGLEPAAEGDGAVLVAVGFAKALELELGTLLAVALDRQQEVDEVGDLLVVHGAAVADAPGRHGRRGLPALLDRLPGDLGDVLAGVALPDLVEVGRVVVDRRGLRVGGRDEALHGAAGGVDAVAAGAEVLEGRLAARDRLVGLRSGGPTLPGRLMDVQERQQQRQEDGERGPSDLEVLQQPALQPLVSRAGAA